MRASLDRVVSWLYGTKPPLWFRLVFVLVAVSMTSSLTSSRGAVMGVAAGVVFGAMALTALLAWDQWVAWSRKHQPLENLVSFPLMFLVIASITHLALYICGLIAAGVVALSSLTSRPSRRRGLHRRDGRGR